MLVQFAALPFRFDPEKGLQLLVITSRDTRRWVIPKGNPMPRLKGYETAANEAYEEAGIEGQLLETPIGHYHYDKSRPSGEAIPALVTVYPLKVTKQHYDWPERTQRTIRWVDPRKAAMLIDEPELKDLIRAFKPKSGDYAGVMTLVKGGHRFGRGLGVAGNIIIAWFLTILAAAAVAVAFYEFTTLF